MKEMVMLKDADGNEIYLAETIGKCREYAKAHNITGNNGEYFAFGNYDENAKYFDVYDYEEF